MLHHMFAIVRIQYVEMEDAMLQTGTSFDAHAAERNENESPALRILLVDDHEPIQLLVSAFLKKSPCRIDIAENGKAGVEKFETGEYDLVLMDIHMPVMNGFQAARGIRALERRKGRKPAAIIAVSAQNPGNDVEKMMEAGFTDFLLKPIDKEKLLRTISHSTAKPLFSPATEQLAM